LACFHACHATPRIIYSGRAQPCNRQSVDAFSAAQGRAKPPDISAQPCNPPGAVPDLAPATPFCEAVYPSTLQWDERSRSVGHRVSEKLCLSTYSAYGPLRLSDQSTRVPTTADAVVLH